MQDIDNAILLANGHPGDQPEFTQMQRQGLNHHFFAVDDVVHDQSQFFFTVVDDGNQHFIAFTLRAAARFQNGGQVFYRNKLFTQPDGAFIDDFNNLAARKRAHFNQ
ncbi:hypothetical protein GALL_403390 [mine drainage metagenome]|uniref:Uncharacterized protein n=1 Tax=mine drainage metagenome TaxID=410659 RepID=A0A1J5Q2N0_9ZZZZ